MRFEVHESRPFEDESGKGWTWPFLEGVPEKGERLRVVGRSVKVPMMDTTPGAVAKAESILLGALDAPY